MSATLPWYNTADWWTAIVSLAALVVSIAAATYAWRGNRSNLQRSLVDRAFAINESFAVHGVKGPMPVLLGIPDEQVRTFAAKSALLFHQLNFLREVFEHKLELGRAGLSNYENWARKVLKPWIENDHDLMKLWSFILENRDLFGDRYLAWITPFMPIRLQA